MYEWEKYVNRHLCLLEQGATLFRRGSASTARSPAAAMTTGASWRQAAWVSLLAGPDTHNAPGGLAARIGA